MKNFKLKLMQFPSFDFASHIYIQGDLIITTGFFE